MKPSFRWLPWMLAVAVLLAAGAWWASETRLQEYQDHSPVLSTRTKGILLAHSVDGLSFTVDSTPVAWSHATSQAHYRDDDGRMWVIGTDPTKLIGRDASGRVGPPKASTLFKVDAQGGERELLKVGPCLNLPQSDRPPVQCVDPSIIRLEDGRMMMTIVRMAGRGDPAVTGAKNEFLNLISTADGGWEEQPGTLYTAAHSADPDLVQLPDGRWRMYFTSGATPNPSGGGSAPGILSAISSDGETFEREAGIRAFGCSASATLPLVSGGYRMYCHTRDVFLFMEHSTDQRSYIISFFSMDGLTFEREKGIRIGVSPVEGGRFIGSEAPSLHVESDGSLSMLITTVVEQRYPWNQMLLDKEMNHIKKRGMDAKHLGRRLKGKRARIKGGKKRP